MIGAGEIIGHRVWAITNEMALRSICSTKEWRDGFMSTAREPVTQAQMDEIARMDVARVNVMACTQAVMFSYLRELIREHGLLKSNYGVHSFKDSASAIAYAKKWTRCTSCPYVIGTVEMWGVVWEHARGYRAQFAKIRSLESVVGRLLVGQPEYELILERLRARYSLTNHQHSEGANNG